MKTPLLFVAVALAAASATRRSAASRRAGRHPGLPAHPPPASRSRASPRRRPSRGSGDGLPDGREPPARRRRARRTRGPSSKAQGLRYVSIPILADTFSLADVQAVEKVLDDPAAGPGAPPLRVLEPRRRHLGRDPGQTREGPRRGAAGRAAGLASPQLEAAVRRVLRRPDAALPAARRDSP